MEPRHLAFCPRYLFGSRALDRLVSFCRGIGLQEKNAVLISDATTWKVAAERISESLRGSGFRVDTSIIDKGAVRSEVDKAREKIRFLGSCIVLGIGGGVSMDVAQYLDPIFGLNDREDLHDLTELRFDDDQLDTKQAVGGPCIHTRLALVRCAGS